uniref:C-type lectin domain-containing protein n=1 Tax=Terrapene triunguis TaxID=2587831 RepID=A0A674IYT6_9SAUR
CQILQQDCVMEPGLSDPCPPAGPACPDGWIGHRGKCYYFSETEGNWTYVQRHCSSFGASLAGIDSEQEMTFLLRHKDVHDHWIGLRREQGQPWKWTNGTEFNHPQIHHSVLVKQPDTTLVRLCPYFE